MVVFCFVINHRLATNLCVAQFDSIKATLWTFHIYRSSYRTCRHIVHCKAEEYKWDFSVRFKGLRQAIKVVQAITSENYK